MGTRSLTTVYEEDGKPLVTLYRQMDGYPTGHGAELCEFLRGIIITNGIGTEARTQRTANGAGCLAAQIIANLKTGVGSIYVVRGARGHGEEWRYGIWPIVGEPLRFTVDRVPWKRAPVRCYDGPVANFDAERVEREVIA